jgi:hypothetical protein
MDQMQDVEIRVETSCILTVGCTFLYMVTPEVRKWI